MFTNRDGTVTTAGSTLNERFVKDFYDPFYGHDVEHLAAALAALRRRHDSVVFLAGDSSLDNKYWFSSWADAVNGYEEILEPPAMKRDVCYWAGRGAGGKGPGGRVERGDFTLVMLLPHVPLVRSRVRSPFMW